jgi:hypothetical protein
MPTSNYGTLKVRAKSNEIVDYHYDETKPGRPLFLLIPGALIALACLVLMIVVAYNTWGSELLSEDLGTLLILLLFPFYVGGVFLFSYGYELYNVPRAIRLTAIIVFITLAAVIILAVLVVVIAAMSKSKSSSRSFSSASAGGSSSGRRSRSFPDIGPIFIPGGTRTVTREVVREVPVAPPEPQPIQCGYCGRAYVPAENEYACPHCGAPTSEELRRASEEFLSK